MNPPNAVDRLELLALRAEQLLQVLEPHADQLADVVGADLYDAATVQLGEAVKLAAKLLAGERLLAELQRAAHTRPAAVQRLLQDARERLEA